MPRGKPYDGPLIDTHAHLNAPSARRGSTHADILAAITAARVSRIVLLPAPNEGVFRNPQPTQAERLDLVRTSGGRVLRMCGSEYLTDWMSDSARHGVTVDSRTLAGKLEQLRGDLKTGTCAGVGEIGFLHFDTAGGQPVVRLPAAYPPFAAIAQVAAAAGMPMDIHAEPFEPDGATSHHAEIYGTIALLFRDAAGLKLIYSHNGLTNSRNARAMLEAFPGLMMNLRFFPREPWKHLDPIVNGEGRLYADWAELLKEMPDRFLIGSDFLFGWDPRPTEDYARLMNVTRGILGGLPLEVARKIASENAQRLFGPIPR
ncbi:MAG TPA: amidohydrolase family protein [Methylomirabilota bacterium]|nr:amidohydrolase family protein [Methylomirabilota bacterium]